MNSPADLPRVLFLTPSGFNNIAGTGITFSNLFRGWPRDRLFTAHNDSLPVSFDVCCNYYRLGAAELSRWPRLNTGKAGAIQTENEALPASVTTALSRSLFLQKCKQGIVGHPWPDSGHLTSELENFIAAARPQLLFTLLGTLGMSELVQRIRDRFQLPVAVHFMDDYFATMYGGGILSGLVRARLMARTNDIVSKASARLAIGEAMAQAYEKRWRVPFVPVQNAVEVGSAVVANPARHVAAPMRLAYIGSIFAYAQAQSLIDIAAAVARLASKGQDICLDVYSPLHLAEPFREKLEVHPAIHLHDTISDDAEFYGMLAAVDALVLPVNFDSATVNYIRYSMPTKVPAYLASGTPILVYGPSEVAQVAYARSDGWGLVVNKRDSDALDSAIISLQTDNGLRVRLSGRAREIAQRHDIGHVRRGFQDLLTRAAARRAEGLGRDLG